MDYNNKRVVLYINGANSYGASVGSYWYYTYDDNKSAYSLYTTLSDLDEETTYSWDDSSEKIEKLLKNQARTIVKQIINSDSYGLNVEELGHRGITNINNLFENGTLDNVYLMYSNIL